MTNGASPALRGGESQVRVLTPERRFSKYSVIVQFLQSNPTCISPFPLISLRYIFHLLQTT